MERSLTYGKVETVAIPYRSRHERPLTPEERRRMLDSIGRALLDFQARIDHDIVHGPAIDVEARRA